jgi:hypothetical protein
VPVDPTWGYFVALEADFARCARYVELAEPNFKTFSIEFAKILLAAGSEVDVACRTLSALRGEKTEKIDQHRRCLLRHFGQLPTVAVHVPRYQLRSLPWEAWATGENPTWWTAYNKVKHFRHENYALANLENALDALAGLMVLTLYLHRLRQPGEPLDPAPQLLDAEHHDYRWLGIADNYRLPGVDPVPPAHGPDSHRRYR